MLLAIDIGNTNLSLARARDGAIISTRRAAVHREATPDDFELTISGLLHLDHCALDRHRIRGIALSSTVPALAGAVEEIARRHEIPCVTATAGTVPIPVRVDNPGAVGPDRIINAYAAAHLHGTPAVVIDCGTATTLDAVAHDGAFIGGAIAPGIEAGLDALAARTARLPRVSLTATDDPIGRDTIAAIQAGTVLGHRAMIEGLLTRMRRDLAGAAGIAPHQVRAVLTGGLSNLAWAATVEGIDAVDPLLTLKGLVLFHRAVAGEEGVAR